MQQGKKYIALFFITIISFGILWQDAVLINFLCMQDTIEAEHCENKSQPELQCHGKCHLQKQLTLENNEVPNERSERVNLSQFWLLGYQSFVELSPDNTEKQIDQSGYRSLKGLLIPEVIFHPPESIS